MKDFIELLPTICWPLLYGGIAIAVFRITHSMNAFKNVKMRWFLAYGIGYVIWSLEQVYVVSSVSDDAKLLCNLGILCGLALMAYLVGLLFNSNRFAHALYHLRIASGPDNDFWDALQDMQHGTYIYATIPADHMAVAGTIVAVETENAQPQIAIRYYRTYNIADGIDKYSRTDDWMGELMDDYSDEPKRLFVIDVKKCGHIELRYPDESNKMVQS